MTIVASVGNHNKNDHDDGTTTTDWGKHLSKVTKTMTVDCHMVKGMVGRGTSYSNSNVQYFTSRNTIFLAPSKDSRKVRFGVQSSSDPVHYRSSPRQTPNRTLLILGDSSEPDRTQGVVQSSSGLNPISDWTPASLLLLLGTGKPPCSNCQVMGTHPQSQTKSLVTRSTHLPGSKDPGRM
jgi:hypothetical protein